MIKKYCKICGNFFERPFRKGTKFRISWSSYHKMRFCSGKCRGKWLSQIFIGSKNPNWRGGAFCKKCGKKLPSRYGGKRKTNLCRQCWIELKKTTATGNKYPLCKICGKMTGDYHSTLCRNCCVGKNHHNWKGGISTLQSRIKTLPQYRRWRKAVFQRDNWTCQKCSRKRKKGDRVVLEPHHIKSFALILQENQIKSLQDAINCKELWEINNGITLCPKCHQSTYNFGGKNIRKDHFYSVSL